MDTDRSRRSDSPLMVSRTSSNSSNWLFRSSSRPRPLFITNTHSNSNDVASSSSNNSSSISNRATSCYEIVADNTGTISTEVASNKPSAALESIIPNSSVNTSNSNNNNNNSNGNSSNGTHNLSLNNLRPRQFSSTFNNYGSNLDDMGILNNSRPGTPRGLTFASSNANRFLGEPMDSSFSSGANNIGGNNGDIPMIPTDPSQSTSMSASASSPQATSQATSFNSFGIQAETLVQQRTYEYYGFAVYLISAILSVLFGLWAYLPDHLLISAGIAYFPSKHWAVAFPAWTMMLLLFSYIIFIAINLMRTPPLDAYSTITDEFATIRSLGERTATGATDDTIELYDLPISVVNACLYGRDDPSDTEIDVDDTADVQAMQYNSYAQSRSNSITNDFVTADETLTLHNNMDSASSLRSSMASTTAIATSSSTSTLTKRDTNYISNNNNNKINNLYKKISADTILHGSNDYSESKTSIFSSVPRTTPLTRAATQPEKQETRSKPHRRTSLRLGSITNAMSSLSSPSFLKGSRNRTASDSSIREHDTTSINDDEEDDDGQHVESPTSSQSNHATALSAERRRTLAAPGRVAASAMAFSSAMAARLKPNFTRSQAS